MSQNSPKSRKRVVKRKVKSDSQDIWAWEVLDGVADFIEANAGNARAIEEMLVKNIDRIVKAFMVLIRPEQRKKVVEWIDRVSKAIS